MLSLAIPPRCIDQQVRRIIQHLTNGPTDKWFLGALVNSWGLSTKLLEAQPELPWILDRYLPTLASNPHILDQQAELRDPSAEKLGLSGSSPNLWRLHTAVTSILDLQCTLAKHVDKSRPFPTDGMKSMLGQFESSGQKQAYSKEVAKCLEQLEESASPKTDQSPREKNK